MVLFKLLTVFPFKKFDSLKEDTFEDEKYSINLAEGKYYFVEVSIVHFR